MKKNVVKNILKAIVTTAMIGAMFIGGNKLTVKADYIEDQFCAMKGITKEQYYDLIITDWDFHTEYVNYACSIVCPDKTAEDISNEFLNEMYGEGVLTDETNLLNSVTTKHEDMLAKVNADRKANGATALVWDAELEAVARQRAIEIMDNVQTDEFMDAYDAGNTKKINEIVHKGYTLKENAIVAFESGVKSKTANDNWITSKGHHTQRIKKGWTKYACASYIDPLTDTEIWVEVFADKYYKPNTPAFDYIRYAEEYPDVEAVFGQDRNALYNHYLTYGVNEGRKAYYTDGTAIGM